MGESDPFGLSLWMSGISLGLSGLLTGLKIKDWAQSRSPSGKLSIRLKTLDKNLLLMTFILRNTGKKDLKPSFAVFFIERYELEKINDMQSVNILDDLTPCEIPKNIVSSQIKIIKRFKKLRKRKQDWVNTKNIRKIYENILPKYMEIRLDSLEENDKGKSKNISESFKNFFDELKAKKTQFKIDDKSIISVEKDIQKIPNVVYMDHLWEYLCGNYVEWGDKSIIEKPIHILKAGIYRVTGIIGYKLHSGKITYVSQHRIAAFADVKDEEMSEGK